VAPLFPIAIFVLLGAGFVLLNLTLGSLLRPRVPSAEKAAPYECGEVSIGSGWVQFDLRFYTIALVFLVFDVEVALFYPWAVVYGNALRLAAAFHTNAFALRTAALIDLLVFFTPLLIGFAYLWRFGYLDWVRSSASHAPPKQREFIAPTEAAQDFSSSARTHLQI
jgi:NADH-quinone oxidoreductase subunit A